MVPVAAPTRHTSALHATTVGARDDANISTCALESPPSPSSLCHRAWVTKSGGLLAGARGGGSGSSPSLRRKEEAGDRLCRGDHRAEDHGSAALFLIAPMKDTERRDLLEVLEDRYDHSSTVITSQVPTKTWHEMLADPAIADAICDRLVHNAHVLTLRGRSMRRKKGLAPTDSSDNPTT